MSWVLFHPNLSSPLAKKAVAETVLDIRILVAAFDVLPFLPLTKSVTWVQEVVLLKNDLDQAIDYFAKQKMSLTSPTHKVYQQPISSFNE